MTTDICKLTGTKGKFINAHIIPAALTRHPEKGAHFIESRTEGPPIRRFSSWTDRKLVTQTGEDILTELDTFGISALRAARLVWSGWGPMLSMPEHEGAWSKFKMVVAEQGWGLREVSGIDPGRLRLFFLSLLWRAAASQRPEFSAVALPEDHLKKLGRMLIDGDANPDSFYPVTLTQLSTIGEVHNLVPLAMDKKVPGKNGSEPETHPIFRFYFDGLIAHFHRSGWGRSVDERFGKMAVGFGNDLVVSTLTYEHSFQRENLELLVKETQERWPVQYQKLMPKS